MGDGRRWRFRRRRSRPVGHGKLVPMAMAMAVGKVGSKYLCTTVTWDWCSSIVPETLMGSGDWLLIVIGVSGNKCSTCKQAKRMEQDHDDLNESN